MAKCYHTGLPMNMCGHCNGTHGLEIEPFTGRRREDETPRLVKMRGKVEWRGLGQNIPRETATRSVLETRKIISLLEPVNARGEGGIVNPMGLSKGSCIRHSGFSAWSSEQTARTLAQVARIRRKV